MTHNHDNRRSVARCATCDATVITEAAGYSRTDANTACAVCGLTLADPLSRSSDYFDLIMRAGRPSARPRARRGQDS